MPRARLEAFERMDRNGKALISFTEGLLEHYPHAMAMGKSAEWTRAAKAIFDLCGSENVWKQFRN